MAYKTDAEIAEDYINNIKYEILKREITVKDLGREVISATDTKTAADIQKAELQLKGELTFLNRMLLLAIAEYDKRRSKIEK
jgi:hypothetical protein